MPRLLTLCLACLCAAAPSAAQAPAPADTLTAAPAPASPSVPGPLSRYGVTVSVGTTGPALAVTTNLVPRLNARATVGFMAGSHQMEHVVDGETLAIDLNAHTVQAGLLVDYHPFGNGVRMSAGAMYTDRVARATLTPAEPIVVGDQTFEPEEVGSLTTEVKLGSAFAPYLGLGWGDAIGGRMAFHLEVGAYYSGAPGVAMSGDGMIAPTAENAPVLEANLNRPAYSFYPELALGLSFRLN